MAKIHWSLADAQFVMSGIIGRKIVGSIGVVDVIDLIRSGVD